MSVCNLVIILTDEIHFCVKITEGNFNIQIKYIGICKCNICYPLRFLVNCAGDFAVYTFDVHLFKGNCNNERTLGKQLKNIKLVSPSIESC